MFKPIRNTLKKVTLRQPRALLKQSTTRGMASEKNEYQYDLVVIGAGSGGVRAARISGAHGAKVALIEPSFHHGPPYYSAIGGTCVNVGCVPKKLFVYGSQYTETLKEVAGFGFKGDVALEHDWKVLNENKNKEIDRLNNIYVNMLRNAGVTLFEGVGSIEDKNTVVVSSPTDKSKVMEKLTAKNILICTGGWPFKPEIPGIEHSITSNEAFYLTEKPKKVVVVGGGYIGVEFAGIFNGYGIDVDLVYRGDLFLRGFDREVREHLRSQMQNSNINMMFKTDVTKIEKLESGKLVVHYNNGTTTECDQIMYATGRKANIDGLNLEALGVKTDKNDNILVDDYSKTSIDNIYAVGDVTNRMCLTPVALYEGHSLADTLFGGKDRPVSGYNTIASAVFSNPEIGTIGYTEEDAIQKFNQVSIYTSTFTPLRHRMTNFLDHKEFMKVVVDDETGKVVGCHICAHAAAEMTQGVAIAVKMGATKADFDATIGIHPTSAEELVTMRTAARHYNGGVVTKGPRL